MRLASTSLSCAAVFAFLSALIACGGSPADRSPTPYEEGGGDSASLPPSKASPAPPSRAAPVAAPDDGSFSEVVYVFMRDRRNQKWFCTGTLVAAERVVTAAHCLDPMFVSYEIVAPLAPNRPRVKASAPAQLSAAFEDVANPDIGFLTLETPVVLGHYAKLTDVGPRVDAGESLAAAPPSSSATSTASPRRASRRAETRGPASSSSRTAGSRTS